jgi:FKBP-type peptidyl-prolyl cis-trans isomerase
MKTIVIGASVWLLVACGESTVPVKKPVNWTPEKSSEMNKELTVEEDIAIQLYLEQHTEYKAESTGSGLRYISLKQGKGRQPVPGQDAKVQYRVTLLDGTECYKTADDEVEVFRVDKSNIETGIQEGIKKMKVGEKAKLIIPSHLAHGLIGDLDKIPPLTTIVVDIELIEVE